MINSTGTRVPFMTGFPNLTHSSIVILGAIFMTIHLLGKSYQIEELYKSLIFRDLFAVRAAIAIILK